LLHHDFQVALDQPEFDRRVSVGRDLNDAVRIGHGDPLVQNRAKDSEHGDGGADPQAEYRQRGGGERGCSAEAAKSDANRADEVGHEREHLQCLACVIAEERVSSLRHSTCHQPWASARLADDGSSEPRSIYSARSASTGSVDAARRAGK
jgi:hypothetical protein